MKKALKWFGIAFASIFVALCILAYVGHGVQEQGQTTTAKAVETAVQHAAALTPEQALVEGGKKDATPGWELYSALYDSKDKEICYTYYGSGQGIKYEKIYIELGASTVYHSNGLIEHSSGRTGYWDAGDTSPCQLMKEIAHDAHRTVVELLAPAK